MKIYPLVPPLIFKTVMGGMDGMDDPGMGLIKTGHPDSTSNKAKSELYNSHCS